MKIIFWGTPKYSINTLHALINSNLELLAVVTQPDKKRLRGNKLISSPVKRYAFNKKIPVITPEFIKGNINFKNQLKDFSCDLFLVIILDSNTKKFIKTINLS